MKKFTFPGSTVGLLLLFSIISYSQNLVQQQQSSKPNQERTQVAGTSAAETATTNSSSPAVSAERPHDVSTVSAPAPTTDEKPLLSESYEATAYSLRGRTASGAVTAPGMIAADPRFLPIGSRVRIEAGSYSGEYLVADTGGAVRGKHIDIWTPNSRDAMRFGRRTVKLTVLSYGPKHSRVSRKTHK